MASKAEKLQGSCIGCPEFSLNTEDFTKDIYFGPIRRPENDNCLR
jgi:hypothetical protein